MIEYAIQPISSMEEKRLRDMGKVNMIIIEQERYQHLKDLV